MKLRHIFTLGLFFVIFALIDSENFEVEAKKKGKKGKKAKKPKGDTAITMEEEPDVGSPKRPSNINARLYCWAC